MVLNSALHRNTNKVECFKVLNLIIPTLKSSHGVYIIQYIMIFIRAQRLKASVVLASWVVGVL